MRGPGLGTRLGAEALRKLFVKPHAAQPAGGVGELGERRERVGAREDPRQRLGAGGADDRVTEVLALLVLTQLELQAQELAQQAREAGLRLASAVQRGAQRRQGGEKVRPPLPVPS